MKENIKRKGNAIQRTKLTIPPIPTIISIKVPIKRTINLKNIPIKREKVLKIKFPNHSPRLIPLLEETK